MRPDAGGQPECTPGADNEDGGLQADEQVDAEKLAQQQQPARHGFGEQHRSGVRFEERRQKARGPDEREEQAERAGHHAAEDQLHEMHGIVGIAAQSHAHGAEAERDFTPDRHHAALVGLLGVVLAGGNELGVAVGVSAHAPCTPTLAQNRMQQALTVSITQKMRDASACQKVSQIRPRTTLTAAGRFISASRRLAFQTR